MLRHMVHNHPNRDFDETLPLIQWAYNNTTHASIGVSPYYAQWGYEPRQPLELPTILKEDNQHPSLESFVQHQQDVLLQVRDALLAAQATLDERMNKGKGNLEKIQVGDEVWLSSRNIGTAHLKQKCAKLQPR